MQTTNRNRIGSGPLQLAGGRFRPLPRQPGPWQRRPDDPGQAEADLRPVRGAAARPAGVAGGKPRRQPGCHEQHGRNGEPRHQHHNDQPGERCQEAHRGGEIL